jgi:hypothetical protein
MYAKECERLVDTVELRHELVKAAKALMPEAIRQAKPQTRKLGRKTIRTPGSAALLRLISRIAMKPIRLEPNRVNPWAPLDPEDKPQ